LQTRSYITGGYSPTQADVAVYKALSGAPNGEQYPHAARWYKHIDSFQNDFAGLPGDASADAASYGPAAATPTAIPAESEGEDEEEEDLFASSDEEESAEKEALTKKRLAEYAAKKASKVKPGELAV
jgi:elongation factor 1-beta